MTTEEKKTAAAALPKVSQVVAVLKSIAPESLASSWDNVGLLVQPTKDREVSAIIFTIDLTQLVMEEAIKNNVEMIIAYHPPIFSPLKRLTQGSVKEKLMVQALENGIAVYSPHTAWDSATGCMTDFLASVVADMDTTAFTVKSIEAAEDSNKSYSVTINTKTTSAASFNTFLQSLEQAGVKSFTSTATVSSIASASAASASECKSTGISRLEGSFHASALKPVSAVLAASDASVINYNIVSVTNAPNTAAGVGRMQTLKKPVSLATIVARVKKHLGLDYARVAFSDDSVTTSASDRATKTEISTVAICAGSGGSIVSKTRADLYLTGEMTHHEILAATANKTTVLLCEHSASERAFLPVAATKVEQGLAAKSLAVPKLIVSSTDAGPMKLF